jgi:hypothetical protein
VARESDVEAVVHSLSRRMTLAERRKRRKKGDTVVSQTTNQAVGPTFITPVDIETAQTSTVAWTTYSADVPVTATAVILDVVGENKLVVSNNALQGIVTGRAASGGGEYVFLSTLVNGGDLEELRVGVQAVCPLSGQSFDYEISGDGFNQGCTIRLIGYY